MYPRNQFCHSFLNWKKQCFTWLSFWPCWRISCLLSFRDRPSKRLLRWSHATVTINDPLEVFPAKGYMLRHIGETWGEVRYRLRCRGKKVAPFPTIVISRYTEEVLFYVLFAFNCMSKLACENIRFSSLLATGDVSFLLAKRPQRRRARRNGRFRRLCQNAIKGEGD